MVRFGQIVIGAPGKVKFLEPLKIVQVPEKLNDVKMVIFDHG